MKFRKLMAVALIAAAQIAEVILIHQMISQSYPVKMDPVQEELSLSCSE